VEVAIDILRSCFYTNRKATDSPQRSPRLCIGCHLASNNCVLGFAPCLLVAGLLTRELRNPCTTVRTIATFLLWFECRFTIARLSFRSNFAKAALLLLVILLFFWATRIYRCYSAKAGACCLLVACMQHSLVEQTSTLVLFSEILWKEEPYTQFRTSKNTCPQPK
jgi:hypothetical protein